MFNRLKTLYDLQLIDDQLDELEELRGDLPNAVKDLKNSIDSLVTEKEDKERERNENLEKKTDNESEIEKLLENQKKYKAQLYQVRNNKEYDALTKEIDHTDVSVKRLEEEIEQLTEASIKLTEEIEEIEPRLAELNEALKVKEADLEIIRKANEKEEVDLLDKRKLIEDQIKKPDISTYMRIRKAKKGKAVVSIKRSACSGCHNIVPSQRQLEIRRNNKVFYCEYCGRILVSPEVAGEIEEA